MPMKTNTTKIKNVAVELTWGRGSTLDSVGTATHTVKSADLDDGTADGPSDGETFEIEGKQYRLGEHDYETSGDETTCTANIYPADKP